jgi:hypothetical protein
MLSVGNIYRLTFPGIAARVIDPPVGCAPETHPFLVESLFLRSRWYVNARGEPHTVKTPSIILPGHARSFRAILLVAAVIFAIYAPAALWLQHRYQPPWRPTGKIVTQIIGAHRFSPGGNIYTAPLYPLRDFEDMHSHRQQSPVLLYENDKLLGPAHSQRDDIEQIGLGRYMHWKGIGLIFSTSDNTDPSKNGRRYWAVLPQL